MINLRSCLGLVECLLRENLLGSVVADTEALVVDAEMLHWCTNICVIITVPGRHPLGTWMPYSAPCRLQRFGDDAILKGFSAFWGRFASTSGVSISKRHKFRDAFCQPYRNAYWAMFWGCCRHHPRTRSLQHSPVLRHTLTSFLLV